MSEEYRVLIHDKEHPWHNHSGELVDVFTTVLGDRMVKIKLDNGMECGASTNQFKLLNNKLINKG